MRTGPSRRREALAGLSASVAALALVHGGVAQGLDGAWAIGAVAWTLGAIGFAARDTWRHGRAGLRLEREGEEWFVTRSHHVAAGTMREPLTLLAPAYRSSWLVVLRLRDPAGRVRTVDVHCDAACPRAFSYLHLACLFDTEHHADETPARDGRAKALRYTARRTVSDGRER